MLIIGSVALIQWTDILRSTLKDIDAIITPEELEVFQQDDSYELVMDKGYKKVFEKDGVHYEFEVAYEGTNQAFLLDQLGINGDVVEIADLELLYAFKMSHRFLKNSPHFLKTMCDIHTIRSEGVNEISPKYQEWYGWRVKDTYNYSHPSLNKTKDEFFDTSVFDNGFVYTYDHDSLHQAVKLFERPAYTYFMNGEVNTSKEEFDDLPTNIQLASVYEESCVLALERAVIPYNTDPDKAFYIALQKVCTSIASGWWREFAWENYMDVVKLYKECGETDYVSRYDQGLLNGVVKPFVQTM